MSKRKIIVDLDAINRAFENPSKRRKFLNDLLTYNDTLKSDSDETSSSDACESQDNTDVESQDGGIETKVLNQKKLSLYNEFMKSELPKFRESNPEVDHKDAFKAVAEMWGDSLLNPKNINRSAS